MTIAERLIQKGFDEGFKESFKEGFKIIHRAKSSEVIYIETSCNIQNNTFIF